MVILQSGRATESTTETTTGCPRGVDDLEFLQPNPKSEQLIRYSQDASSRFWVFYQACHLEAFGHTAPFGRLLAHVVERIARLLDESVPEAFKNPGDRRTFSKHADKARRVLRWAKFDRKLRTKTQRWLNVQAERSDDPEYLQQLLEARIRSEPAVLPAEFTLERMVAQARSAAQDWIAESIAGDLGRQQIMSVDRLRKIKEDSHRSYLQWIKDPVGCPSPNTLNDLLDRIDHVREIALPKKPLEAIHPDMRRRMTVTVQVYSVDNLYADFQVQRRRAYVACYLYERLKGLIDLAVETFDSVVQGMYRRSESDRDEQVRRSAPAVNEKLHMFSTATAIVVDLNVPDAQVRNAIFDKIPREKLMGHPATTGSVCVLDFWRYAFSNLNSNVLRGALAEFLVETAVRNTAEIGVRNPWGDYDIVTPTGRKVEVKCAAYLQDWDQTSLSRIA